MKRAARVIRAVVTSPPVAGAIVVSVLAAWAGRRVVGDDADLGSSRRVEAVEYFVAKRFAGEIAGMKIGIFAIAIALGLVIGLCVEVLQRVRYAPGAITRRREVRAWAVLVENVVACAAVHAAMVAWGMADSPQLYAARWYAKGGLARTTQVFATDVLGTRGVIAIALGAAIVYARPWRIWGIARRWGGGVAARIVARRVVAPGLALGFLAAGTWAWTSTSTSTSTPTPTPTPTSKRPNILIIAADSLRADRVDVRVAPRIAALAANGVTFERAYVSIPRTFPSWVTWLTGRHAHHHGVREMFPRWEDRARDFDALPQRFGREGYATGVVSDYAGDIFSRIDLGFGRVDAPSFDFRQIVRQRALERETPLLPLLHSRVGRRIFPVMREMNDAADPRLLASDAAAAIHAAKGQPFFLTVFFSTAHFPYAAPAPYYAKFSDPAYRGRFKYHKPVGLDDDGAVDAADVTQIRALYDGSVAALDDGVGHVLDALAKEGVADDTIVVVTADHGETLYENGHGQGHGDHLFGDEGTHVPLVVVDPRAAFGRGPGSGSRMRFSGIVRDVDLAPTLYELAGITPPTDLDGRSLVPAMRGAALEPRFAYAESELWFTEDIAGLSADLRLPYPGIIALTELDTQHGAEIVMRSEMIPLTRMARHRMVRDEKWKLVYVPTRKGVRYMLFDTTLDPGEVHDVAAQNPGEVERLKGELWAWMLRDARMEQKDGYLVPRSPGGTL